MNTPSRKFGLVASIAGAGVVTIALLLVALAVWSLRPTTPEGEIAVRLAGERWYAVTFRHTPIGHYRSEAGRTGYGDFEFQSVLRFKLADGDETRIEDRLVFQRRPPHRLLRAEYAASGGTGETRIVIADSTAEVMEGGSSRHIDADSDLELRDYLAVQRWLANETPNPGDVRTARSIDFEALKVTTDRWRLVGTHGDQVELAREQNEPGSAADSSRIRLGPDLAPTRMDSDDLVSLERVRTEAVARVWEGEAPLFASAAHRVPVDTPIADADDLKRLVVQVDHPNRGGFAWPGSTDTGLLAADADPQRTAAAAEAVIATRATVNYPASAPELKQLAARAVGSLEGPRQKANALTLFVHHHLSYRDTAGGRTVFDTIRDRTGDCTEFADLFTTLARAAGLPARTVVGLAYQDESQDFGLHAWNEVVIDGHWRGVDPTWGQTRIDATHLPLPADGALSTIAALPQLRFRVVEARY